MGNYSGFYTTPESRKPETSGLPPKPRKLKPKPNAPNHKSVGACRRKDGGFEVFEAFMSWGELKDHGLVQSRTDRPFKKMPEVTLT